MKYYAVIDTNVIVSALLSSHDDSAVVKVFKMIIDSEIIPLYSIEVIKEYKKVLSRKKFSINQDLINYIVSLILNRGIAVSPKASGIELIDMKDLVFYEIVLEKKKDGAYLITGNKKHFSNNPIVATAREFLDIIKK